MCCCCCEDNGNPGQPVCGNGRELEKCPGDSKEFAEEDDNTLVVVPCVPGVFKPSKFCPVLRIPPEFVKADAAADPRNCRVDPYETLGVVDDNGNGGAPELGAGAWGTSTITPGGLGTPGTWTRSTSLWSARDGAEEEAPRRRPGDPGGAMWFAAAKMDCLTSSVGGGGGGAKGGRSSFPNADAPCVAGTSF